MLSTNLLPEQEKKEIRLEQSRRIVIFISGFLAATLFIASLLLIPSYLPLVIERKGLEDSLQIEENASLEFGVQKKVASAGRVVSVVSSVREHASKTSRVSAILAEFVQSSDSGIVISFLNIKKGGEFTLIGRASTRNNLLNFEKRLRESKKFEDFSSPLSNIIRETDINFSLQGKIKPISRF